MSLNQHQFVSFCEKEKLLGIEIKTFNILKTNSIYI
jgi:hypothetical protein